MHRCIVAVPTFPFRIERRCSSGSVRHRSELICHLLAPPHCFQSAGPPIEALNTNVSPPQEAAPPYGWTPREPGVISPCFSISLCRLRKFAVECGPNSVSQAAPGASQRQGVMGRRTKAATASITWFYFCISAEV